MSLDSEENLLIEKVKKLVAERKVYVEDIFKDDDIINYVSFNFKPEDVFHEIFLFLWAENNFRKD